MGRLGFALLLVSGLTSNNVSFLKLESLVIFVTFSIISMVALYNPPMSTASPRTKAILLALFVTVLWSTSWVLIKIGLRNSLPAITFAGLRYTLAFVSLAPFVLFKSNQLKALKRLTPKEWGKLALLGVVYYTITQSAMFLALAYLPANTVSLLLNLTSIFVGISGIFLLKEHPTLLQWSGIGLAMIGVGIYFLPITYPKAQLVGVGIGLVCMLANVASSLLSREVNRSATLPPLIVTFVSMGIGSILMLITGLAIQGSGTLTTGDWLIILWMAIANTALAFTLWNQSLQVLTAVESSILNSLMLPQIAILAYLFLGEGLTVKNISGLVLVGIGTIVVQIKPHKSM
jgi:drug/metabolite transporter (DMT)-like permease